MPLSQTAGVPAGTNGANLSVVAKLTSKVLKSRLLIPSTSASAFTAAFNSASVWTSIRESNDNAVACSHSSHKRFRSSMAAINKTASAP